MNGGHIRPELAAADVGTRSRKHGKRRGVAPPLPIAVIVVAS